MDFQSVITAVGAGQDWKSDLTSSGWKAIEASKAVFFFRELEGFAEHLLRIGLRPKDVSDYAEFGTLRHVTYRRVAEAIIDEAGRAGNVSWVTQGNPAFFCGVTKSLRSLCPEIGVDLNIVVGPSALDHVIADLFADGEYCSIGLQVLDAGNLLRFNVLPNPLLPCLLFQLARTETDFHTLTARLKRCTMEQLTARLLQCYAPTHPCKTVLSRGIRNFETHQIELQDLPLAFAYIGPWTSLYLPQREQPSALGDQGRFASIGHLEEMYETPLEALMRKFDADTP
jgi:hypothetical protein